MISRLQPAVWCPRKFANKVLEHHNRSAKGSNGVSTVHRSFALLRIIGHRYLANFWDSTLEHVARSLYGGPAGRVRHPPLRALFCYVLYSINSPRQNSWPDLRVYFSGTAKYPLRAWIL